VEIKKKHIGIISLGWLGEELAKYTKENGHKVWGTVMSFEKANRIKREQDIEVLVWKNSEGISDEMAQKLKLTDVLVLNLPPSVFQNEAYASGLTQFLPFLSENAKVLFTSSTSVYPAHLVDCVETYLFGEKEVNKIGEAENELIFKLGSRLTILRLAGLVGEDRNPVYYLAKKATNDVPNKVVNLIHRKDVIRTIETVIQKNFFGEILNVCHPNHPTRKEYYSQKANEFNLKELNFSQHILNEPSKIVNCDKLIEILAFINFTDI
jgi:nucleoside-diphosphate-sugar epimerase